MTYGWFVTNPAWLRRLSVSLAAFAALTLFAAGCATTPTNEADRQAAAEANDPIEPTNRAIFDFNNWMDDNVIRPVAETYQDVLHQDIRDGIRNFVDNMSEPVNFVNAVLQGKDVRAAETMWRFLINTTVGVGGIGDPATSLGYKQNKEDFGQTLAVWGVDEGPFIMLPLLGPSSVRGVVGKVADNFTNPIGYFMPLEGSLTSSAADGIDRRERNLEALDDIRKSSLDYYAALRSLYRQNRAAQVKDGEVKGPILDIPVYTE